MVAYSGERDKGVGSVIFAISNATSDFTMDCDTAADAELADVLATLINELIRQGIVKGEVSA